MIAPSTPQQMLVGVAGRGLDGSARASGRVPARRSGSVAGQPVILCWPNYACAVRRGRPCEGAAADGRRLREAQELGSYHLIELLGPRRAWARSGAPSTGCSRATRRSSWCGRKCSARATTTKPGVLRRFEREAQATAALSSPHTIQVFDFGMTARGHVLLRDGAADRARPRIARARVRSGARRARDLPAAAGLPLAGRCARPRARPPRHQAGQHLRLPHGPRVRLRRRCSISAW